MTAVVDAVAERGFDERAMIDVEGGDCDAISFVHHALGNLVSQDRRALRGDLLIRDSNANIGRVRFLKIHHHVFRPDWAVHLQRSGSLPERRWGAIPSTRNPGSLRRG